jgi:hypothetical protein
MATSSAGNKTTNDLEAATNSCTMPLGAQEVMTKATTRPRRLGWLVDHHHAYSAATTGTVRHTTPLRDVGTRP